MAHAAAEQVMLSLVKNLDDGLPRAPIRRYFDVQQVLESKSDKLAELAASKS